VAYARAGATLVEMGTASFAAPRAAERVIKGLRVWGRRHRVDAWRDLGGENPNQEAVWRK
jgi:dihydroorotate dehydrogenase (NAD+) catalytic subunit